MSTLVAPHIEVRKGAAGERPRVVGKGVLVQAIVVWHQVLKMSADDIAASHGLSLAEVHSALAYYFDHQEEVDRLIREDDEFVSEMKRQHPSLLQEKLRDRFGT